MKIRVYMQVDLATGDYDLRCDNLTDPQAAPDLDTVQRVVGKIMAQLAARAPTPPPASEGQEATAAGPELGWGLAHAVDGGWVN